MQEAGFLCAVGRKAGPHERDHGREGIPRRVVPTAFSEEFRRLGVHPLRITPRRSPHADHPAQRSVSALRLTASTGRDGGGVSRGCDVSSV